MELKDLKLTEKDFDMIVEGLEALPEKGVAGEMMGMIFESILLEKNNQKHDHIKQERMFERSKKEQQKRAIQEEVRILQGKLLQFKRFLVQEGLLAKVHEIMDDNQH